MTNRAFTVVVVGVLAVCAAGVAATGAGEQMTEPTIAAETDAGAAAQPTEISSCTAISEPGRYVLAADVENSSANACIRIQASDVVLDGNGHVVDGVESPDSEELTERFLRGQETPADPTTSVGVAVAADRSLSNVTVTDLSVTDWRWGVVVGDLRGGEIEGIRATNNGFGVVVAGARDVAVTDGIAGENAVFGVGLFGVAAGTVGNVTASGNGLVGVYHSGGSDGTLANVTARDNDLSGVLVEGTTGATVSDATASGNRIGILLSGTSDAEVTRPIATENEIAGVYAVDDTGTAIRDAAVADNDLAGVMLRNSADGSVVGTDASNNRVGIYLLETARSTVSDSTATDARRAGVLFENATDGRVVATDASRNQYGILLFRSANTTVTDSIANNGTIGVLVRNSTGGAVLDNEVLDSRIGGVTLDNSNDVRVANNRDGAVVFESTGDDAIGEEGGIRHDDDLNVNQSDGLTDAELRAVVYRAIARAEYLRQLEYQGNVSLEVVSRDELERRAEGESNDSATNSAWDNQFWEALFVVGEDANATAAIDTESTQIGGFYHPLTDKMVVVSEREAPAAISSTTLVHEFVHALQDQHFDLSRSNFLPRREDQLNARNALVEGDARYADERFESLCGVVWNCLQVESNEPRRGNVSPTRNFAMRQLSLAPYSDGPGFVEYLRQRGGWEAVNDAYDDPPNSTERIIHSDRRDEPPVALDFENTARSDWRQFDSADLTFRGEDGTTTMGEFAIFTMFWYQGYEYDNPVIDTQNHLFPDGGAYDWFNYTSEPSEGWGNDAFVPYRNEAADEMGYGYVWKTEWDTPKDAREFRRAYRRMLRGHGAERVGRNTWVIDSGPFADAFRVVREGTTVTIVNAPTEDDLEDVRPGLADETTADETTTADTP